MNPIEPPQPPSSVVVPVIGLEAIVDTPPAVVDQEVVKNSADERQWLENERIRSQVDDLDQDRRERRKYAHRVFCLVVGWLLVMNAIVILQGFHAWKFDLPTTVMVTLVGGTTGSVVGVFLIVASYLFPKR